MSDTVELARQYASRGWSVVPIEAGQKGPRFSGWQTLRLTAGELHSYFHGGPQNVGVILGAASGNLADLDLDCATALTVSEYLLPSTDAAFGRGSSTGT